MTPIRALGIGRSCGTVLLSVGLSFAAASLVPAMAEQSRPAFLPGFPDVPLMHGLDVSESDSVVFDKPNGRILESSAVGMVPVSEFVSYYQAALPGLGWRAEAGNGPGGPLEFRRAGEVLQIEFAPRGQVLSVRFFLSPS